MQIVTADLPLFLEHSSQPHPINTSGEKPYMFSMIAFANSLVFSLVAPGIKRSRS